ncbi:cytochrome P450 [Actinoplanes sp. NPDC048791]|uniref:cytochrome P450 family protein n=1 Tax=Actinoplanes sp. NPDC048791 TaxID=3154623 RepID=UPI0033D6415F
MTDTESTTEQIPQELFDHRYMQDPHAVTAMLRRTAPVRPVITPNGLKVWLVTRYDDVRLVMNDARVSKNMLGAGDLIERNMMVPAKRRHFNPDIIDYMLNTDPPKHTRLRTLVLRAFTAGRVEKMRPRVQAFADEILGAFRAGDEIDVVDQLAFRLPMMVILDLLGIPLSDTERLRGWVDALVTTDDPASVEVAGSAVVAYLSELIEAKRVRPDEGMLSSLVNTPDDEDQLTGAELMSMIFLLVVAGYETTVHTIGNATLSLLTNADQRELLQREPERIAGAIDELMRFDTAVSTATFRFTTEAIELSGVEIPAGEFVLVSLLSANHDEDRFPDGAELDVTRSARGHVAFGYGIHYCMGAQLGRMEVEIALSGLLRRFPDMRLAVPADQLVWRPSLLMHGLERLPVRL